MKEFFMKSKKALIVLCCLLVFTFVCMIFADQIQKSWGKVEVKTETMEIECDPYPGHEGEAESHDRPCGRRIRGTVQEPGYPGKRVAEHRQCRCRRGGHQRLPQPAS